MQATLSDTDARNLVGWTTAAACLAVLAAVLYLRTGVQINTDVAWFVVTAERMLEGGHALDDFFEVNMPLATVLYIPAIVVARLLQQDLPSAILIWSLLLVGHSLWLMRLVAGSARRKGEARWLEMWSMIFTALVITLLPGYDFAEREHFIVVLALPFVWMLARGTEGLSSAARFYITLTAALGFYAKPHYALLPFLLLLMVRWTPSSPGISIRIRSPEWIALIGAGFLNAMFVGIFYPEWFTVAAWAGDLYGHFKDIEPARFSSAGSFGAAVAASTSVVLLAMFVPSARRAAAIVMVCTAYSWLAFWLQGKGWRYQLLPALLFPAALLPWLLTLARESSIFRWRFLAPGVTLLGITLFLLSHSLDLTRHLPKATDFRNTPIGDALSITRPGDGISAISISGEPFLSAAAHYQLEWRSRFSALWPLVALVRETEDEAFDKLSNTTLFSRYGARFIGMVADDLRTRSPNLVLVDLRSARRQGLPPRFDLVAFLSRDPRFQAEWARYVKIGESGSFAIFARRETESASE